MLEYYMINDLNNQITAVMRLYLNYEVHVNSYTQILLAYFDKHELCDKTTTMLF